MWSVTAVENGRDSADGKQNPTYDFVYHALYVIK